VAGQRRSCAVYVSRLPAVAATYGLWTYFQASASSPSQRRFYHSGKAGIGSSLESHAFCLLIVYFPIKQTNRVSIVVIPFNMISSTFITSTTTLCVCLRCNEKLIPQLTQLSSLGITCDTSAFLRVKIAQLKRYNHKIIQLLSTLLSGIEDYLAANHLRVVNCLHKQTGEVILGLRDAAVARGEPLNFNTPTVSNLALTPEASPIGADVLILSEDRVMFRLETDKVPCVTHDSAFSGPRCNGICCRSFKKKCSHTVALKLFARRQPPPADACDGANPEPFCDNNPAMPPHAFAARLSDVSPALRQKFVEENLPQKGVISASAPEVRYSLCESVDGSLTYTII